MSYTIEYKAQVAFVPDSQGDKTFYCFVQEGESNIRPRPRDWHLLAQGWKFAVIHKICCRAGETEGGCLQMSSGSTTPEAYLKKWRKLLAEAQPLTVEWLRTELGLTNLGFFRLNKSLMEQLLAGNKPEGVWSTSFTINKLMETFNLALYEEQRLFSAPQESFYGGAVQLETLEQFLLWAEAKKPVGE